MFYMFNAERVLTKKYLDEISPINEHHFPVGNYFLDKRKKIDPSSIIYSVGILRDVSFDLAVSGMFGCNIFMYDPTPESIEYMKTHSSNAHFKFFPLGVWTENTTLKFFIPEHGGSSSAIYPQGNKYFEAECKTIQTLMSINNHSRIDVFKADIEGAALPVLEQMIHQNIFPEQIIIEFERPSGNLEEMFDFFYRVSQLKRELKKAGYEVFNLPREKFKYFSLELLFVRV